ncbi:MAG: hypothetical protein ACR2KZ_00065 [Segetibacter sp.]
MKTITNKVCMDKDENIDKPGNNEEPATVAGPASYEEELKDYSKTGGEDLIDNMPDSHPEPSPTRK